MSARQVVHTFDQAAAQGTKVCAVVQLGANHLPDGAAANGDELRERITELHGNGEQERSHQKRDNGGVSVREPLMATTGICDQWDSIGTGVYVKRACLVTSRATL